MVPEKLQVRNFMCYGEDVPPLDFAGLHVTCLSGHNGAGKSALLDALTWVLWGKARAKSDDDMIMIGREEMEVVLDFLLDDQLYRVIRRRKRGKRAGVTTLQLQAQESGGGWRNLSGDTIAETQNAINRVLRIEYETFVNSAFLVQGRADEFTGRKPAERKQVLADILGLSEYEDLERLAKDEVNRLSKEIDIAESHLQRLRVEVDQRPRLEQALEEAQQRVALAEEELLDQEAALDVLREQAARLRERGERRSVLAQTLAQQESLVLELTERLVETRLGVERFEAVLDRRAAIEAGVAELGTAQIELEDMSARYDRARELRDELNRWKQALELIRGRLEADRHLAAEQLQRIDEQLGQRPAIEAELAQLQETLAAIQALQDELRSCRAQETELVERQTARLGVQVAVAELHGVLNVRRDSLIAEQQAAQRRVLELEGQAAVLPALERQQQETRAELLRLQAVADELATRRDELSALSAAQGQLKADSDAVVAQGTEIKEKLRLIAHDEAECPVCGSELGHDGLARITAQYEADRAALLARHGELTRQSKANAAEIAAQRTAIDGLERTLAQQAAAEGRRATLALQIEQAYAAEQALVDARALVAELDERLTARDYAPDEQRHLGQLEAELAGFGAEAALRDELKRVRARIAAAERELGQAERVQRRAARLDADLAVLREAEAERPAAAERYAALAEQIATESFGADERVQIDAIMEAGRAVGFNKEAYEALRVRVGELRAWESEARELETAAAFVVREREQLRRDETERSRVERDLEAGRRELADLDLQLADRNGVEVNLRNAVARQQVLQRQRDIAQNALGSTSAELERCARYEAELAQLVQSSAGVREQHGLYEELAQAFGKKGIQAMLIETAIPELEHEANELLARMTDNQFHLSFETQRDTRKGDATIETLDIRIADGLGTRDYQMYSGGEAFRINFAIRIALSKLLARRAGASLKTLIIDEGFGSQDASGRDRLVEAINSIESEFERILVITHIQELKDLFQTQIEIRKTLDGSTWVLS